jgi:hypothetical protein
MKLKRNKLYRACGFIILACIFVMAVLFLLDNIYHGAVFKRYNPTIWFETAALWAFGISWLVKGNFILKDKHVRRE